MTSSVPASVDPARIQEVLDGRWAHVRRDARENLHDPDFLPVYGENVQEARARVTRAAKKLADSGRVGFGFPKEWREALVESEPEKFSLPSESDMRYHWVHARLDALELEEMRDLVENAWALCVPKRVAKEYAEGRGYPV